MSKVNYLTSTCCWAGILSGCIEIYLDLRRIVVSDDVMLLRDILVL